MIGACLWVVQVPVTKTKNTVRKVKFPHTSIVFTLDPNSNKNNDADDDDDDDDDEEEEEEEEDDDDDNDDDENGQFTQKFTKLSAQRFLGSFGCIILAKIG